MMLLVLEMFVHAQADGCLFYNDILQYVAVRALASESVCIQVIYDAEARFRLKDAAGSIIDRLRVW